MDQAPGSPQEPQDAQELPGCYRHPDRQTGIRCVRCERPICPACMVSASVGFQCPDCVRGGSGTGHAPGANQPRTVAGGTVTADPRLITKVLIGLCLAAFVVQQTAGDMFAFRFEMLGHAFVPGMSEPQGVAEGQWYRLLTAMFLHGGFFHLGFNMLSLWWIGGPLEAALGRARYLALYVVSGLAGSALTYLLADPAEQSLGASGAIFGLIGATGILMRRLNFDLRPLVAMLVINLIFTFTPSFNIAWQAHIGGLVGGLVVGYAMVHAPRERRALVQFGACAVVLVAVLVTVVVRTGQLT
ncbi:rhomboid family intramembrane serine protease [Streptomyces sp. NPDC006552]|uniref:rhomboid family intramembrane serine protease n=1 Tax=Streptomyces sp. NPDC006552 TaxID=3157179 RepID=UPI0033B6C504